MIRYPANTATVRVSFNFMHYSTSLKISVRFFGVGCNNNSVYVAYYAATSGQITLAKREPISLVSR